MRGKTMFKSLKNWSNSLNLGKLKAFIGTFLAITVFYT